MADINIQIGDQVIAVPEWATESTLQQLRASMQTNARFEKSLLKLMGTAGQSLEGVEKATKDMAQNVQRETKKRDKDNMQTGRKVGRAFNGLINRFNQTEKPLTAMVDLVGDFGSGLNGVIGGLGKINNKFGGFMGTVSKNLSKYGGPIMEAGLAYAGFVAAKVEQFADAQKTLIDAGAIFMEGGIEGFEQLRSRTYDAGISYDQLSKIVSGYGVALQSLSNGVSGGTDAFVNYFTAMNDTADAFGDFGMASGDMATAYAEYINVQRLTGRINKDTTDAQSKLNKGFTDLMLETSALAALTGENRSELLKRRMSALSEVDVAASLKILRNQSKEGSAQVLEEITKQLADVAPHFGEIGATLTDALNREAFASANNIETFDIERTLDPITKGAINKAMPNLLDNINSAMQSGNIEGVTNMVRDALLNVEQEQFGSALATKDTVAGMVREIQKSSILLDQAQGNLANMGKDELDAQKKITEEQLKASGEITKNFNNLTEGFLKAQDALTPSMDMASTTLKAFGDTLKAGADFIQGVNTERKERVNKLFGNDKKDTPEARKMGGPVASNIPYTVGERGPEIFVPDAKGEVFNQEQIAGMFDAIYNSQKDTREGMGLFNQQLKTIMRGPNAQLNMGASPELMDNLAAAGKFDEIYKTIPQNMRQYFNMPGDDLTGADGFDISWDPSEGWSGSKTTDDGVTTTFDKKGLHVSDGAGTTSYDHDGNKMQHESARIGGLQTTTYADGSSKQHFIRDGLEVPGGDGHIGITKNFDAQGNQVGSRLLDLVMGSMRVKTDDEFGGGLFELEYNMGGGLKNKVAKDKSGMVNFKASQTVFGPGGAMGELTNTETVDTTMIDSKYRDAMMQTIKEKMNEPVKTYEDHFNDAKEKGLTNPTEYANMKVNMLYQLQEMIANTKRNYITKRAQENLDA